MMPTAYFNDNDDLQHYTVYLYVPLSCWFTARRFLLPGINGLNFVLRDSLGGGGVSSLRPDPQGKSYGQMLLDMPIRVPKSIAQQLQSN